MRKGIGIVFLLIGTMTVMSCGCGAVYEESVIHVNKDMIQTREEAGITPEDDFYGYTNFDFLWGNEIPSDMAEYSTLEIISSDVDKQLKEEIMRIVLSEEKYAFGSDEQKIKDFYLQYVNTKEREENGLGVLGEGIVAIESAETMDEFLEVCGVLYKEYGCSVLLTPYVSEDSYNNEKYALYLQQMDLIYNPQDLLFTDGQAEKMQEITGDILNMSGIQNSDEDAYKIVDMILEIAESTQDMSMFSVEDGYNAYTKEQLQNLLTNINTEKLIKSYGIDFAETYIVYDIKQMEMINECLREENLNLWKGYAIVRLLYDYREYLPENYRELFLAGDYKSMEDKAISAIKNELSGELSNVYMKRYVTEENVNAAMELTQIIKEAYRDIFINSKELDDETRQKLLLKLDNMTLNIGCPGEEFYSSAVVSGSLMESGVSIKSSQILDNLSYYGKETDPTTWYMTPWMVNAVYYTNNNSITVPYCLFQKPIFEKDGDLYRNLGGLGMIIAHEMTHAFDKQGIQYDEKGCYNPQWISKTNEERILNIEKNVKEYYEKQMVMDAYFIDGELTVNENIADIGAMEVISSVTDNKTELQSIFESYAVLWATLSYDTTIAEQILFDVHSPAEIRVNGVLSSIDKFYSVYDVTSDDEMYIATDERARVWQ